MLGAQNVPRAAALGSSTTAAIMMFTLSHIRERHRHQEVLLKLKAQRPDRRTRSARR